MKGSYVQTLTLTDIATGWTECAPVPVREQKLLTEVLSELRKLFERDINGRPPSDHQTGCHRAESLDAPRTRQAIAP